MKKTSRNFFISFSDTESCHTLSVINNRDSLSTSLDEEPISTNEEPQFQLPEYLGFKIASHTALLYPSAGNGFDGKDGG